jgi:hypothetical protein
VVAWYDWLDEQRRWLSCMPFDSFRNALLSFSDWASVVMKPPQVAVNALLYATGIACVHSRVVSKRFCQTSRGGAHAVLLARHCNKLSVKYQWSTTNDRLPGPWRTPYLRCMPLQMKHARAISRCASHHFHVCHGNGGTAICDCKCKLTEPLGHA